MADINPSIAHRTNPENCPYYGGIMCLVEDEPCSRMGLNYDACITHAVITGRMLEYLQGEGK